MVVPGRALIWQKQRHDTISDGRPGQFHNFIGLMRDGAPAGPRSAFPTAIDALRGGAMAHAMGDGGAAHTLDGLFMSRRSAAMRSRM